MNFLPVVVIASFVVFIRIAVEFERAKMKTLKARLNEAQGKIDLLTEQNVNLQEQVVERQAAIEHLSTTVDELNIAAHDEHAIINNRIQRLAEQIDQIEEAYGKCFTLLEKVGSERLTTFQLVCILSGIARKNPGILVQAAEAVGIQLLNTNDLSTSPNLEKHIVAELTAGRKVMAIKLYRQGTGAGLKEAVEAVEKIQADHNI